MCTGAILLYKIPRVVIGENVNFQGKEELLKSRGVEVVVLNDKDCITLMKKFIEEKPEVCGFRMRGIPCSLKYVFRSGLRILASTKILSVTSK
jgi:tRNA(Arg) A34 adenosine deaminase TadA